jgi:capsular exopolysaccharide synthesis family protein
MDATTTSETPEIKLHFLDYWRVIRLRRSLILVVFLLCVMTSTLLTIWLPKQYSSTVQIEVQKDTPAVPLLEPRQVTVATDPFFLSTEFKKIESWRILTNVIAKLNLQQELARQNGADRWDLDVTFEYLSRHLSVEQTRMTSLIEISVRNPNAQLAADIANGIASSYREDRLAGWKGTRGGGIAALALELATNKLKLDVARSNLDEVRIRLHIPDLYGQSPITQVIDSKRLEEWDHQRVMAEADFLEYSNILHNLDTVPTNRLGTALVTAYAKQIDPELTELAYRLESAKEKMVAAEHDYGPKMPAFETAQKQLEECQAAYQNKIDGMMTGIRTRVKMDQDFLEIIRRAENDTTEAMDRNAQTYAPYYALKQEVESDYRIYEDMERHRTAEVAEMDQPDERIVQVYNPARAQKFPVSPKAVLIIPLGVIVGLIVGLGLAFFIEYLDTSVKTIDDVERALQAPVLGVIPQNVGLIIDEGAESPHAEAYRVLRTNILFSRKNESWNTLSVLSGGAGEGKSTTLFNLATVFAQNGQRTLVVDSDLRRPTLHKSLHISNTVGLTDFLLKQRPLEEVIQKTKLPTLDFMPSGKLPSSSMSILGSAQMKETIQELKRRYEFIFFDSPPLLGVSDASILASEMDMVLQVVQYRRYPQPMTLRAKQMILKVGGNLVGIVLNNINMSQDENYYYYSGYYEYQYQRKDQTVVQVSDAAKTAKVEIKPKY